MNPSEKFVNDFQRLFPEATIYLSDESGEQVIYHNVNINNISHSDKCAFDHICETLDSSGVRVWLNYMEVKKEKGVKEIE